MAILVAGACSSGGDDEGKADPGATAPKATSAPGSTTATTQGPPPPKGVFVVGESGVDLLDAPGGETVGRIRAGVLLPYAETSGDYFRVTTPCDAKAWVARSAGEASGPYRVAIDPGHGGDEPGATGEGGLTEEELNLAIARYVVELLANRGIPAVLTRSDDYRAPLKFRIQLASDAGAEVFVSIHHNAEPDEQRTTPGTEAYFQINSEESKRLTGLVYEEVFRALSAYDVSFAADFDAGAKYRLSDDGDDYYGVIRRSFEAGIVGTLLESGFISNPAEEALLQRDDVRRAEAAAIATAIGRYFRGDKPGDVFTEPYPRTAPAGPGGGAQGCVDPS